MENNESKIKQFIKDHFITFLIFFISIVYVFYGMITIGTSGKTIIEIIGSGVISFLIGYIIKVLLSLQGMMSGNRKKEVIDTNEYHSKCVTSIDPHLNKLDTWCDKENIEALKKVRKMILNAEGLRYQDCFDDNGIVKDVTFERTALPDKTLKKTNKNQYKIDLIKAKNDNTKIRLKEIALAKAIKVNITQLSSDTLTTTYNKIEDPHDLGIDKTTYLKREMRSDFLIQLVMGIIFSYFTFSFMLGFEYLISSLVQIALFLGLGGIKYLQSYIFVTEELRAKTVKKINYIQRFRCDMGLVDNNDKEIVENENNTIN